MDPSEIRKREQLKETLSGTRPAPDAPPAPPSPTGEDLGGSDSFVSTMDESGRVRLFSTNGVDAVEIPLARDPDFIDPSKAPLDDLSPAQRQSLSHWEQRLAAQRGEQEQAPAPEDRDPHSLLRSTSIACGGCGKTSNLETPAAYVEIVEHDDVPYAQFSCGCGCTTGVKASDLPRPFLERHAADCDAILSVIEDIEWRHKRDRE